MENKPSMSRVERLHREKVTRYSIRKYSFGAASVAVAALFMFLGNGAVSVQADQIQPGDTAAAQPATPALDKTQLESYISEIETKLSNGSYDNKTEESVAVLKAELESAKATLANATTQAELKTAYSKLVTTANSKLKNKPVEKKETPAVDTTEGKETVGKKAENTEKNPESNSIENTGSKDERNGKPMDKENAFRAETTENQGNFTYSMEYSNGKEIYLYNAEDADVNITVNSTAGKIKRATVKAGSGQFVLKEKSDQAIAYAKGQRPTKPEEEEVERDDYGWSYHQIITETQGPVTIKITGQPNDTFKGLKSYTKTEDQRAVLGARYLELEDSTGAKLPGGRTPSSPGYFNLVVKSQTYKYDIQPVAEGDKVSVADINNLTPTDINNIKEKIKIQYSDKATTEDARLASKKGEVLADRSTVVKEVAVANGTVTVTYNDDSVDTTPVANVARTNPAPTVELPYSNADKRQIYVYTGENTDLTFTGKDETTVKNLYLRGPGGIGSDNTAGYGFTTGKIDNDVVTNGEGTVSADKRTATIKMTGVTTLKAPNQWTSFIVANDNDDASSMPSDQTFDASTDNAVRQQRPGYVQFVVKSQTDKYDIKAPTEKVTVADPANVTDEEFDTIKAKLKLEYNKSNDDANISKDADVADQNSKIASIEKDAKGNLVVTYTDGSKDTRPLSDFINKAPTVELPYSNVNKRQIYVYTGENTDLTFTGKDDTAVKNLYLRGPGDVTWANAKDYGFKIGAVSDSAVSEGEGTVSADKRTATIKMTGVTTLKAPNQWTSFIEAKDNDDAKSMTGADYNATTDDAARQQKPGYVQFVVKNQTSKYDIAAPTEKVAVTDPANVTEAELEKIKEKLQIEYSNNNDDANLADKKGKTVDAEDAKTKIASVTKDAKGNLVVTYTDGSKDTRPLSEFVTLDKQPAIDEVNKAAEKQIDAINKTPNATDEEKQAAIDKVNADKKKALDEIAKPEVTTKDALDKAQNAGTDAIAKDNPVVAKKDEAKQAIDDALTAKNKEIDDRTDLTPEEKTKAKEVAKAQADVAKAAVDNATTNAAVDKAKADGTTAVANVTPVAKAEAKKAIAKALEDKNSEIDKRTDLTDEEKTAAKNEAKDKADAQLAKINEQPDAAATPTAAKTAQDAVDAAKKTGVDEVTAVNPVAVKKPAAKKVIDDALKAKEAAIDARPDLTDDEKKAAKDAAKAAADKAKEAVDAATTDAAVDAAKGTGTGDIAKVNPVAKEAAKKAVADELAKKEAAIDARPDLTDEEKDAAKKDAQAKAKAATDAINTQPSNAETPEKAAEAQKAVDGAKDKGVADVKAVNPEAVKKPAAKKAIDDALKAKEAAIDARPDLTDAEKKAAKDAAKDAADKAKEAVDAAPTDAAVDAAKETGTGDIAKVNPVAKEAAKKAVADELAKKEAAIDARPDLTDEEKAAAKEEAQAKAKEATDAIDAQPANAETPEKAAEAQTAVDGAKKSGVDEVAAVNPEAKAKPAAKKAIEDKLAKQLEDIANTPDATDEEKKVAADAAKAQAEEAKEEIDKAGTDAEVKQLQEAAEGEIEKSVPVVEDKPNARKAIDEEATAKKAEIDARNDLTPEAKAKLKAKVDKAAEKSKAAIDAVSSVDDVNTIEEADKAAIKAIGEVNRPIDKVLVKDPSALTDEEKAKILEEVKKVNPTAKEVKYDENGNIEVTTEAGDKGIINPTKLVKTEDQLDNGKGGNDINKPLDKVIVKDPSNLTDEEKAKIVAKVEEVNPDAIVTINEDGTVSVSTPDGKTAAIPASELVRTKEDTSNPDAGNSKIVKPADKVAGEANDPDDQAKVEEKLRELNPETKSVKFDEDGNATVTLKDGTTATIPSEDLFKSEVDATKPNAGNDIVKPADKTVVANPEKLTDAEKKAIEDKVKAVNPDATVVVDDKGNATVTTPEGKTAVIPAADLTKDPEAATKPNAGNDIVKPADKTVVANPEKLTDAEKKAIEDKVKAVNPDATVVVDDKGNATVTTPEGKTAVIPAADVTKSAADAGKANAGNAVNTPAAKVEVKDPAKLTDEEKAKVKKAIEAVNPGSKVVVDDKGNATVTTPEGNTAVIPAADVTKSAADAGKANAGNAVNTPAAKVEVKDPANLTDAEKKAIENKVKAVNPGSKVVVDDKGNATVTTPEGKTATIPATDLTKSAADAGKENAGNGANTPATKTVVKDPANLTDEEKAKVKKAVEDVNPGSTVVVNDKGDVIVTKGDGTVLVIPELDLVIPEDKLTDPTQQNGVNTPATRVLVGDKAKLTADEIEKVKESIKAVNPGATVVVDENGNATVTTPEGKTATIPAAQLVKDAKDVAAKNNGENINIDFEKETVADFNNLTDAEKEAAKAKIKGANADVAEVIFDKAGNATVITKDGKVYTIVAKDIFKQRPYVPSNGGGNNSGNGNGTSGNNAANNTDAKVNKAKLEGAIHQLDELIIKESAKFDAETAKEANALSADAKKVFANADASQAEVDAMVKRIEDFMAKVASSTDHATPANDQAAQKPAVAPATTQAAANASQEAATNARKAAKELPNTGTADSTVAMVAAAASALLGLGLAGRRRKEDEEA